MSQLNDTIMNPKAVLKVFYYQRYMGIFLTLIGIPILFIPGPQSEFPLMIGLFMLFTSFEKIEDERSLSIKMSSLYIGFIFAYALKMLLSSLFTWHVVPMQLTEINHFIILVLAIAVPVYQLRMRSKA
jgi:hypothetical protein